MKPKKIVLIFLFLPLSLLYPVTGEINQLASSYSADATINQNFTFQGSDANPANFTGIIFKDRQELNISPNATVTVNVSTRGGYIGYSGIIFRGQHRREYTINGGNVIFNVNRVERVANGIEGLIVGQAQNYGGNARFILNTNFSLTASNHVYIQRGVFTANGPGGLVKFTKNVFIDVSQMMPSLGWGASRNGKGYRMILSLEGNGGMYVNYNEATGTTLDPNNIIQLKGDLSAEATSSGEIRVNLDNPQSFFQGRISNTTGSKSNIELYLNHGGKWILNASSQITTLNTNNEESVAKNQYGKLEQLAVVDFTKIADDGLSDRLTSLTPFASRTLNVGTINGTNGAFRLMADMQTGRVDRINVTNLNGLQYIQIYQNSSKILLNNATTSPLIVATARNVPFGANFEGITTTIGIYDYFPVITRQEVGGTTGTEWVLGSIKRSPSKTSQALFDILSLPYQIFRLQGDSLYHRTQDLFYPPTLNGLWAKVYGGGIYPKQPYINKTQKNLFWNIQGGYDKAKILGENKIFYGGSLDYIKLQAIDDGSRDYQGDVNSVGFGGYGGYVQKKGLVLDGGIKYVYSSINSNLYQANNPFNFSNHILLTHARMGYNFYLFTKNREKIVEKCVQKVFCRNDKITVQIRDDSAFIQPYFSIAPAIISGNTFSFIDKASSRITSHLHFTPSLITKLGILGVKRFTFQNRSILELRASSEYSNDINMGGKVTLTDTVGIPLEHTTQMDNRIGIALGSRYKLLNESLELYFDFKTEFLGHINTYWLLSAGFTYKFGQNIPTSYKSLNLRPKVPSLKKQNSKKFRPYDNIPPARSNTFHQKNHFKEY